MESYFFEWLNLLLRWLHVIAAVAWIGESVYFVMLDNSLHPPKDAAGKARGVFGEMWSVHGGGFYHNQKYLTNPPELPDDLHWSFWKSYTTWLSGFALFSVLYLLKPDFYLVDTASPWSWAAKLSGAEANLTALGFLVGGWLVYDQLCRRISPNMQNDGVLAIAVAVMMVGVAYLTCHIFQGRAAFLITGAVMATSMSANVFFWIIPGQRRMVADLKAGRTPNPLDGKRGKQRSVHNTYFTMPVALLMISNHYAFTYGSEYAWVVLSLFIFAGALIRQYFVLRHSGRNVVALPAAGIALLAGAAFLAAPKAETPQKQGAAVTAGQAAQPVSYQQVQAVINARCIACHAATPSQPGFTAPPAGIRLETETQVKGQAVKLKMAVAKNYMPLANMTQMTAEERQLIADWSGN